MHDMRSILVYMGLFLAGTLAVCAALFEPLRQAFAANQVFNAMIVGVLVAGILINVRQVLHLGPALVWLRAFRNPEARLAVETRPRLLAPMQRLLTTVHREGFHLSALTMRTMLDSIRLRLEESREVSRYMTGLLVFLGLLGTFWGLLDTVDSVGGVIGGLSAGDDVAATFSQLKSDLQRPLAGMGTAFSSSLFGLGGALVLGFFDLQAGHAQNRFYNQLEEWLSDLVHLPAGTAVDGDHEPAPAYADALIEHTAERLSEVGRLLARGEEDRRQGHERLLELATRLGELTARLEHQDRLLEALTRSQLDLQPAVEHLAASARSGETAAESLNRMESLLRHLGEDAATGRAALSDELRGELRLLARVLSRGAPPGDGAGTGC